MRIDRQILLLGFGSVLPVAILFLATPYITGGFDPRTIQIAGAIIVINSTFGLFDLFRPILTRNLVKTDQRVQVAALIKPSIIAGVMFALLQYAALNLLFDHLGHLLSVTSSLALLLFLVSTPFWALIDSDLRSGTAHLVRSSSTALTYIFLVAIPLVTGGKYIEFAILAGNSFNFAAMLFFAARRLAWSGYVVTLKIGEILHIFYQNMFRLFVDNLDRYLIIYSASPALSGRYAVLSEFTAKTSVVSQVISYYFYPRLCKNIDSGRIYVAFGFAIAVAILAFAVLFRTFGEGVFASYLGINDRYIFEIFTVLVVIAAINQMHFYAQSYLRASRKDSWITFSMVAPVLAAAAWLMFAGLDIPAILTAALILKASGALMTSGALSSGFKEFWVYIATYVGAYVLAISWIAQLSS